MPGVGGFYKGEKKKQKKGRDMKQGLFGAPIIQMPEIISRKKKDTF